MAPTLILIVLVAAVILGAIWVLGRRLLRQVADSGSAFGGEAMKELIETNRALREEQAEATDERTRAQQAELGRLVDPMRETLDRLDKRVEDLDKEGKAARAEAKTLFEQSSEQVRLLGTQTESLSTALRKPQVRGSWGESQLRRCFELAGMSEHVDFVLQDKIRSPDGRLRPDATVRLPQDRFVIVDSKVPLEAYLDYLNAEDEASKRADLTRLASGVRTHIKALADKDYQRQFGDGETPDFVVCFIRAESALQAAFDADPALHDFAIERRVLITTPTSLIGLLHTIEFGWRQEKIAEDAIKVADITRELHSRFGRFLELFAKLGRSLTRAQDDYEKAGRSIEKRLMPQLRQAEQLGAGSGRELEAPARMEQDLSEADAAEVRELPIGETEPDESADAA